MRRGLAWLLALAGALGSQSPMLDADERAPRTSPEPPAAREKRARRSTRRAAEAVKADVGRTRAHSAIVARSLALFLLALAFAACAPEGPVDACIIGETQACQGCRVGALRMNLPRVSTRAKGDAEVTTWGPCRCAGDASR